MSDTQPEAMTLAEVQDQASRYLRARYGDSVVYRAPETFGAFERWVWAIGAGSARLAEECMGAIEDHFTAAREESQG
jgi:hypothetical protein